MARCKSIERKARQMRGDWNGAMQSRLDTAQMGNDMMRNGVLITGLVGIACQAIGRDNPWSDIEQLNASQARAATRRLETIYTNRVTYADSMQQDKWYSLEILVKTMKESNWRDITLWTEQWSWKDRVQSFVVSKQKVVDNAARAHDAVIANARLPLLKQKTLPPTGDPISQAAMSFSNKAPLAYARNDAGNALWLVALALHAYKLEHKSYPQTLNVLVGDYLKEIPVDAYGGGEKLHYKRVGNTYRLWSIGPDGVDNGGAPVQHDKNASAERRKKLPTVVFESKGDYVANLNR